MVVHRVLALFPPCEFVFDDQREMGRRAAGWWPEFKKGLSSGKFDFAPYFTASPPMFKRDTEFAPLQAADLYAGQMSRVMRSESIIIPPSPAESTRRPLRRHWCAISPIRSRSGGSQVVRGEHVLGTKRFLR